MTAEEIRHATTKDDYINMLSAYMMHGWPLTGSQVMKITTILIIQR